jgi:peptidoglycan/xylan/chitin deacetylase (PgdA/CDA1 family)
MPTAPAIRSAKDARRSALILLYHQVAARPRDLHGLAVDPVTFRSQLEHLRDRWQPVSLSRLAEASIAGEPLEAAVAVTFDDGYLDNLEHAAPLLAEFEIPATFFLTAERLDCQRFFWWDCLELVLEADVLNGKIPIRVDGELHVLAMRTAAERRATHDYLYSICKASLPATRDDVLRQLSAVCPCSPDMDSGRPMTAAEIQSFKAFPSIAIGAHGLHHVSLSGLAGDQLQREVFESRTALERVTGRTVDLFAYPYGDVSPEAVEMVRAADYRFAVTCEARSHQAREERLRLPRLEPPRIGGHAFAEWMTQAASTAGRRAAS